MSMHWQIVCILCSVVIAVIGQTADSRCPEGMEYTQCGSPCPRKCGTVYNSLIRNDCNQCVTGCQCKSGLVLNNNDQCVQADQCPCIHTSNKQDVYLYKQTRKSQDNCFKCTCGLYGYWNCIKQLCGGTCEIVGFGAMTTFDGGKIHVGSTTSTCKFHLVEGADFSISLDTTKCATGINAVCIKGVKVVYNGEPVELKNIDSSTRLITISSDNTDMPYSSGHFYIKKVTNLYYIIEAPGIRILFSDAGRLSIKLQSRHLNKTRGLCGRYNRLVQDEFELPSGVTETTNKFLQAYSDGDCGAHFDVSTATKTPSAMCNELDSMYTVTTCSNLQPTDRVSRFKELCEISSDPLNVCPIAFTLMGDCRATRQQFEALTNLYAKCSQYFTCENGYVFHSCQSVCNSACRDYSINLNCEEQCVPGCSCPTGELQTDSINGIINCVELHSCTCYNIATNSVVRHGISSQSDCNNCLCSCTNAIISCDRDGFNGGFCPRGLQKVINIPTECRPRCPDKYEFNTSCAEQMSSRRCFCPIGQWENVDGTCIPPETCSCYHIGNWYGHNRAIDYNCLTLTCRNGVWRTSASRNCTSTCWVSGDPHYSTFDGITYKYQGDCTYNLVKTASDVYVPVHFTIYVENVICGSTGVSCTKTISININGTQIVFSRLEGVKIGNTSYPFNTVFKQLSYMTIHNAGSFLFLNFAGVTVMWDAGSRLYVTLTNTWKGKVQGLCGNFDDNLDNDFTTETGTLAANEVEFGNSWKVGSCGDVVESPQLTEACMTVDNQPSPRTTWARNQCKIIQDSPVFENCRNVLNDDVDKYYIACLYDACGCDRGGDTDCLCTAISNFVDACNRVGQAAKWRSQQLCPIQCEHPLVYQPCGSSCPKTCDDPSGTDYGSVCEQTPCVEGCFCPDGLLQERVDETIRCVKRNDCHCVFNGMKYAKGHTLTTNCLVCTCINGTFECTGNNCSHQCTQNEFTCKLDRFCIPMSHVCNGLLNCIDGSDEIDCERSFNNCTDALCDGTCEIVGVGSLKTFDGASIHIGASTSTCKFNLVMGADLEVSLDTTKCITGINAVCIKGVKVVYNGETVELKNIDSSTRLITTNNDNTNMPYSTGHFYIKKVTNLYYIIEAPGIRILFSDASRLSIKLQSRYLNKTAGACGKFNNEFNDEFELPSGGGGTASEFLQAYSDGNCGAHFDVSTAVKTSSDMCNELDTMYTVTTCSIHQPTDRVNRFKELCEISSDPLNVCPIAFTLMGDCKATRQQFEALTNLYAKCSQYFTCESGYVFNSCQSVCNSACRDYSINLNCEEQCVPGCSCPTGELQTDSLSGIINCVKLHSCTCYNIATSNVTSAGVSSQRNCNKCTCINGSFKCTGESSFESLFQCEQSGFCISPSLVCNGVNNCVDGSDEIDCENICPTSHFKCWSTGQCFPFSVTCDGKTDCQDGSDEYNCAAPRTCTSSEFTCSTGACIPDRFSCNNVNDCGDFSDEENCSGENKEVRLATESTDWILITGVVVALVVLFVIVVVAVVLVVRSKKKLAADEVPGYDGVEMDSRADDDETPTYEELGISEVAIQPSNSNPDDVQPSTSKLYENQPNVSHQGSLKYENLQTNKGNDNQYNIIDSNNLYSKGTD